VKFTRRGGRIQARLERVHSQVEVSVSDTGVGLSPAFLPHIFERFRQADSRFSRQHGGLGLGLAISRHLVEMHGGTITAESDGGDMGSTFRVCIPVMPGVRPADAERGSALRAKEPRAGRPSIERLDGLRVVAVDDEEDALILLRDILQAAGASVTTVRSPAAAAAVVEGTRPDVFITDIGMKEMDGFRVLAQVRESTVPDVSRVPAVALTAYARSEDRLMALKVGFQMHLAKPIDPDELVAAVRTLTRRPDAS
jgi:CheY-like chemotaxis protein